MFTVSSISYHVNERNYQVVTIDIDRMLNKYEQAKQMMKQMRSGGGLPPFMRGRF